MTSTDFDVVVIGTGPAGSTVARKAAGDGHRVAIVEAREFGGTCALRGCNPKKVYANAGQLIDQVRRANGQLVTAGDVHIDWAQLLNFKRQFTEPVLERSKKSFQDDGIETLHGTAHFCDRSTLQVADRQLTADRFVIATGARPAPLPFTGSGLALQSDDFFELAALPKRIVFIGGGYVSMEFAHVAARAGAEVTVVERNNRVLDQFDPDLVELLQDYSEQQGISFQLGTEVECIRAVRPSEFVVELSNGSEVTSDLVVHGAGRIPNIEALNLEAAGIETGARGISVDHFMRSPSNDRVFAAGDCADSGVPPLTPSANEEARIVANNLFADEPDQTPDYGRVPQVAFTTPSITAVGQTEEQARQSGGKLDVLFENTSDSGSVRKTGGGVAGHKIIVDADSDKILGAHLVGPAAEETINLFALAMKFDLTATNMKSTLFAFPTFASDVRQMV